MCFKKISILHNDFMTDYHNTTTVSNVTALKTSFSTNGWAGIFHNAFTTNSNRWLWIKGYLLGLSTATSYGNRNNLKLDEQTYWRINIEGFF